MDPSDDWWLLARCARLDVPSSLVGEIRARAARVQDWTHLLDLAESHGVATLLRRHVEAGVLEVPAVVHRQLSALYVRHHHANDVRLEALSGILAAWRAAGIEAVVLKGPALMSLVYGDPALRPIVDLDLLVREPDTERARATLESLGFVMPPFSARRQRLVHHLPPATRTIQDVAVDVEIHRRLFARDRDDPSGWEDRQEAGQQIVVAGERAIALGPQDMLWHLARHLVGLYHPLRLIWVADIVSLTERYAASLDWPRLGRSRPFVLAILALLDQVTPLAEDVRTRLGETVAPSAGGVGREYAGWPRQGTEHTSWLSWLSSTIVPPEWWMRLSYSTGRGTERAGRLRARHWRALARTLAARAGDILSR